MNNPVTVRARRDFVTNESYMELLAVFEETIMKETQALTADAMAQDVAKINTRAGSIEGMKKLIGLMGQYREQSMQAFKDGPQIPDSALVPDQEASHE